MRKIILEATDYQRIIEVCAPAVDAGLRARPNLTGIELQVSGNECIATSLNGYILAQCKVKCFGSKGNYVIPAFRMKRYGDVTITKNGEKVSVSQNGITYTKLTNDEFFDWKPIVELKDDIQYSIYINPSLAKKILSSMGDEKVVRLDFRRKTDAIQIIVDDSRALLLPVAFHGSGDDIWFNFSARAPKTEETEAATPKEETELEPRGV